MQKWIVLALALGMTTPVLGQVHKCEVDGRTVYQGAPCPAGSVSEEVANRVSSFTAPPVVIPPAAERQQASPSPHRQEIGESYQDRLEWRNAVIRARNRGIVLRGMDYSEVRSILGRPNRVTTSSSSSGVCRQMFWHKDNGTHYVRMCGGVVEYYSRG